MATGSAESFPMQRGWPKSDRRLIVLSHLDHFANLFGQ